MRTAVANVKQKVRHTVWDRLEATGVARFPRPVHGRIPNFIGADAAAQRLAELPEFRNAQTVKVSPDAPQRPVRRLVLTQGKVLLTPTPRIREGFLLLKASRIPAPDLSNASTIGGAFKFGERVKLDELPSIDLIVVGSVAVTLDGARVGKGEGYSELEFAILKETGRITDQVPVATTVHDLQIVPDLPFEAFDVPVDLIITPTQIIRTPGGRLKPKGILWDRLSLEKLQAIPILRDLRYYVRR